MAAELEREVGAAQALHGDEGQLAGGGADLEHADDVRLASRAAVWASRRKRCTAVGSPSVPGCRSLTAAGDAVGGVLRLVDLAHAAAAEQDAEAERADDLIGEAAGAADLERASSSARASASRASRWATWRVACWRRVMASSVRRWLARAVRKAAA